MMDYRNNAGGRARYTCTGKNAYNNGDSERMSTGCGCAESRENTVAVQVPVMVYIVDHPWQSVYLPCRALSQGTLFPALDKPFFGKGGCCND